MDMTACNGDNCPLRMHCLRYRCMRERYQSYFMHSPYNEKENQCEYLVKIIPTDRLRVVDE